MDDRDEWTADWAVERERRMQLLDQLPGKRHQDRFESLNRASRIFSENSEELGNHISTFVGTYRHVDDLADEFEHKVVRLFHNYIASVATLRDVQRATHRQVWPTTLPPDERRDANDRRTVWEAGVYESKALSMFGDEQIKFLFDLRNFTVHYAIPVVTIGTTWRHRPPAPPEWINRVELRRDALNMYTSWSGPAKRFMAGRDGDIDFLPLVSLYSKRAREFYGWFWDEVKRAVFAEVEEYHRKGNEFRLWLAEVGVEPDWRNDGNVSHQVPGTYRRKKAQAHAERMAFGSTGWGVIAVDSEGSAVIGETDWPPLPPVGNYAQDW